MKLSGIFRHGVIAATCCSMLFGQMVQGANPTPAVPRAVAGQVKVQDITLQQDGSLKGQVHGAQGTPIAKAEVVVVRQGQIVARTTTDAKGQFTFAKMSGGVHQIVTEQGVAPVRIWTAQTAPGTAQKSVAIEPSTIIRAQGGGSALAWLANPWVLAGIVAAAIAIPLALDNNDAS